MLDENANLTKCIAWYVPLWKERKTASPRAREFVKALRLLQDENIHA
jgi:hypothetical protein